VLRGYAARDSTTVVGGLPKAGKSHFVAEAVGSVSVGARFLGHETLSGAALWVDLEQPQGLTARLLTGYCLPDAPVYVQWGALPGFDAMRAFCERADIVLVVVDSLARVFELAGVEDENDAAQVGRALQPLLAFARTAHVALLVVHHLRKSGGNEGLDLRGSGALAAAVDVLVSFRRYSPDADEDDTRRVLHAYSRYDETPRKVVIERVDGHYRVVGTPGEVRRRTEREKVLAVLTAEPRAADAIAAAAGLSESAARTVLKLMAAEPDDLRVVSRGGTGKRGDPFVYSTTGNTARTNNYILRAVNGPSETSTQEADT
jgi:predicted ATP-dependent serine protease